MIHIAGLYVQVGTRYKQRCAWCDVVLVEGDREHEMIAPGSHVPLMPCFNIGSLVELVESPGCRQTTLVTEETEGELPLGSCAKENPPLRLVEKLDEDITPTHTFEELKRRSIDAANEQRLNRKPWKPET